MFITSSINNVTTIMINDGKVNALNKKNIDRFIDLISEAEAKKHILVLRGKDNIFSAGYDMKTIQKGDMNASILMIHSGFKLLSKLYHYPYPTLAYCVGHAVGLGAFMLCCCDFVIATKSPGFIQFNEMKNNMHIPSPLMEIALAKLNPRFFDRALLHAEKFDFKTSIDVGFVDLWVDLDKGEQSLLDKLNDFSTIGISGYTKTKNHLSSLQGDMRKVFKPFDDPDSKNKTF